MRLSLVQQFAAAVMLLTLGVLLASLLLARWSFERGFSEYIYTQESRRLAEVAAVLAQDYSVTTGWGGLTRRQFYRALRTLPPAALQDTARNAPPGRPPPRRPWSPGAAQRDGAAPQRIREVLRDIVPEVPPTALLDGAGAPVWVHRRDAVRPDADVLAYPIRVGNTVVGELRSWMPPPEERVGDSVFSRQQKRASLLIFFAGLLLALLLTLWMGRRLLAPLRGAHDALGRLADGDYTHRLSGRRRDELGELMSDIDRLAQTLESNQSARRRWIADISHELRTPVAVLKAELEAIVDGLRPLNGEQIASLQGEVERIVKLIDDLYQLATADLGALAYEFAELDLAKLLRETVEQCGPRFAGKGLKLGVTGAERCVLRGDDQRLRQLLRNILENSLAYTDAPGSVELSLRVEGADARLEVCDSAPCVAPDTFEQLFDPLYREESSRNRRHAGAGLGLAISRAVAEAHGGSIEAGASPLGGLRITVLLPLVAA